MRTMLAALAALATLSGCAALKPTTLGEASSGYTYVPIDPLPVVVTQRVDAPAPRTCPLLHSLPDNAVRMLVEQDDAGAKVSFGPQQVGAKNESYRVTIDYINADVVNVPLWIRKSMHRLDAPDTACFVPLTSDPGPQYRPGSEVYMVSRKEFEERRVVPPCVAMHATRFTIPVYVGVGLRATAHVTSLKGNVNLSGLGVIGIEAEAQRLRGSLVVQTLGVNGKAVASALPVQSELNRTTAQNAIVAVATIKNALHGDDVVLAPRAVGFYLPFPGSRALVNLLVTTFNEEPLPWPPVCPPVAPESVVAKGSSPPKS